MTKVLLVFIMFSVFSQPAPALSEREADLPMPLKCTYNGPKGDAATKGASYTEETVDGCARFRVAQGVPAGKDTEEGALRDPFADRDKPGADKPLDTIADPLEPINRAFFVFNDKLYFWVLKPVAKGYGAIVPQGARVALRNFFYNLAFPVRFVNCLLQGKGYGACDEMGRFFTNTFIGAAGFIDVATLTGNFGKYDEDLGQTFGSHGAGPGFYINWPIFGPSSLRDTVGTVGDAFLDPISILIDPTEIIIAVNALDLVNGTSLRIGDYEDLKKAALDPYISVRDAYYQNRKSKIKE
jgi:phospholipid-binding lipoprotein MlaA